MADNNNHFSKDPNAVLDYTWDWKALTNGTGTENWLSSSETIASKTVTVPSGLTLDTSTNTASKVTAWISGGSIGVTYEVVCRIVTNSVPARTDERSIFITIKER